MLEFLKKLFRRGEKSSQASSGPDPVAVYALTSDTPKKDPKHGQGEPSAIHGAGTDAPDADSSDVSDGDFDFD